MSEANTLTALEEEIKSYGRKEWVPEALVQEWKKEQEKRIKRQLELKKNKEEREQEIDQSALDTSISIADEASERESEKEKAKARYRGKKSMVNFVWAMRGRDAPASDIYLARLADILIKDEMKWAIEHTATALGYEAKSRSEISNYRSRRVPKIQCGKQKLYLVPRVLP